MMRRYLPLLACVFACDEVVTDDGGVDAANETTPDAKADMSFTIDCADATFVDVVLSPIPPSCPPCPATMPPQGSACDASIECEYGTDERVGCNPMAVCGEPTPDAGLRWFVDPVPTCGPLISGTACTAACVDASVWCVGSDFMCQGAFVQGICQPFRDAALGCPCTPTEGGTAQIGTMVCGPDDRYRILAMP